MKKIILLLCLTILLTGCSFMSINNSSISSLVDSVLSKEVNLSNSYFDGYKYYLPRGLKLITKKQYNAKLINGKTSYYLYVDVVSYYNKVQPKIEEDYNAYYFQILDINNKKGYIKITREDDDYLVKILYNYAKIEVMTDEVHLKDVIVNSCYILSSIKYNDTVIETLIGENTFDYKEKLFEEFAPHSEVDEFLKYKEDDYYQGEIEDSESDEVLITDNNE